MKPNIIYHKAPEQEAILTISDEQLIKVYNINLLLPSHVSVIANARQAMREELISRDIITEEHEGEVVI